MDGAEATEDALCLPCGEATGHRCTGSWGKSGIETVDVKSQVGGVIPYNLEGAFSDSRRAFLMDDVGVDDVVTKGFGVCSARSRG